MRYLSFGKTQDEIAHKLNITIATLHTHLARARRKLKAKNSTHAVAMAMRWRILHGWLLGDFIQIDEVLMLLLIGTWI